jgi:hypothetical protein
MAATQLEGQQRLVQSHRRIGRKDCSRIHRVGRLTVGALLLAWLTQPDAVAAPDSPVPASHELSIQAITTASADWGGPGTIGKWCRTLKDDGRHLAYGDLDGDGKEDAAIICTDGPDGSAGYVAAILNRAGAATAFGGWEFGNDVFVKALTIESGAIVVTLNPPGTTQQQTVRFKLGKKRGALQLDLKDVPVGAPESDWLSYTDDKFHYSFRYPRNVFLWSHYQGEPYFNRTIKGQGEYPFTIEIYDRTPDAFLKAATNASSGLCDLSGDDGDSYGDIADVESSEISGDGLSGIRQFARCRDRKTRAYNRVSYLVYAFDLSFNGTPPHILTLETVPEPRRQKVYSSMIATFKRD